MMLQEVVPEKLPSAIPAYASLDGLKELSADTDRDKRLHVLGAFHLLSGSDDSMLPVEADLNVTPGATSTVKVGDEASVFAMPTGERQFLRRMGRVVWTHCITLHLA